MPLDLVARFLFMICSLCSALSQRHPVPDLNFIRTEIERMRGQVHRQRKEILQLQRAGISTASAELLLARMHTKIDGLCAERERLKASSSSGPKAAGVGDAGAAQMVRRQRQGQPAVDRRAGQGPASGLHGKRVASDVQSSGERTFETADVPQKTTRAFLMKSSGPNAAGADGIARQRSAHLT
jgi:hypothetical protein